MTHEGETCQNEEDTTIVATAEQQEGIWRESSPKKRETWVEAQTALTRGEGAHGL